MGELSTPARLLIAGFSVTEKSPGYSDSLAADLRDAYGIEVDVLGIGGLHPRDLAFLIDDLFLRRPYDVVVLEVTTSSFRSGQRNPGNFASSMAVILHKVLGHGAVPIMLHLYRKDVDPFDDPFTAICDVMATRLRIPSINLAKAIAGSGRAASLIMDMVHPTEEGAAFYAEALMRTLPPLLRGSRSALAQADEALARSCQGVRLAGQIADGRLAPFLRKGVCIDVVELAPEAPLTIELGTGRKLMGLAYVTGPRSGGTRISGEHGHRDIVGQDGHSYYERLTTAHFGAIVAERVTIAISAAIPDVTLLKGEPNREPRLGKLTHVFVGDEDWRSIEARSSYLWQD